VSEATQIASWKKASKIYTFSKYTFDSTTFDWSSFQGQGP